MGLGALFSNWEAWGAAKRWAKVPATGGPWAFVAGGAEFILWWWFQRASWIVCNLSQSYQDQLLKSIQAIFSRLDWGQRQDQWLVGLTHDILGCASPKSISLRVRTIFRVFCHLASCQLDVLLIDSTLNRRRSISSSQSDYSILRGPRFFYIFDGQNYAWFLVDHSFWSQFF